MKPNGGIKLSKGQIVTDPQFTVRLMYLEEGDSFRFLDKNGKATGARFTVVDCARFANFVVDSNQGRIVVPERDLSRKIKPLHHELLQMACRLKYSNAD